MTDSENKVLRQLIADRINIALIRLNDNSHYIQICEQQIESEAAAEEAMQKLEKPDRITIRRHYEGEVSKTGMELDETYIQGLRDCVTILKRLGMLA